MALAAAGVVSLSSVAQAQEAAAGADALAASTTLTGYVSSSYTMDGTSNSDPAGYFRSAEDNNKFALDVVSLTLASAQGAGEYATGYTVQLWAGDAAGDIDTNESGTAGDASTVELMQANIDLRLPIGNGLDLKVGQMGTVVGAETYDYNANAFYTRSFAFAAEPTHHTGILASYQLTDDLSVSAGLANSTDTATTNDVKDGGNAVLLAVSYTTPDTLGVLGGTELYYGGVLGASNTANSDAEQDTHYLSASVPVPVEGLSYSVGWTIVDRDVVAGNNNGNTNIASHYLGYVLTESLTLNVRYEHGNINSGTSPSTFAWTNNVDGLESLSVGLDYALWDNVTSRIEWREDSGDNLTDQEVVALNVVYSF
jgi:hypothetical protein